MSAELIALAAAKRCEQGMRMISLARLGDYVTFRTPEGYRWTGIVTTKSEMGYLVLDLGAQSKLPGIATRRNILRINHQPMRIAA